MAKVVAVDFGAPPERRPEWDANRRRFLYARRQIEARGVSAKNCFRVRLRDMSIWTAEVKPGTVAEINEMTFIAEVTGAVSDALNDYFGQEQRLKNQHGMNLRVSGV